MLNPSFTYRIATMGCKANLTDSHALESALQRLGGRPAEEGGEPADLYLLNTCTVTDQADKEAKHLLRATDAGLTIATGCLAEVDPGVLAAASPAGKNVRVIRNSGKWELESVVSSWLAGENGSGPVVAGDRAAWHGRVLANRPPQLAGEASGAQRTRAFLKVQDGCNAFCSYCVIPLARGRSRSVAADTIVAEVGALAAAGVKEVVLTAIHAADYDHGGLDFTGLVEKVLRETGVPRVRLTSLDPAEIPDRLLALMQAEPRLCPHFHVSLQSASSGVLRAMKRGYSAREVEERLLAIAARLPHAYVGLDLIAGFPTETAEEFEDSYARLERLPWTRAHVFPFSVRRSTVAARLVAEGREVPRAEIQERAARLRALGERKLREAMRAKVGAVLEVLVEEKKAKVGARTCSQGHARNYHRVLIPADCKPNELIRARIVGVGDKDYLKGELL